MLFSPSAVCAAMKSMACCRVQPSAWIPVSTTSATGAPGVEGQDAEPVDLAGQQAHLGRQALGVQAPALDEGGRAVEAAEVRQLVELLGDRELEVMAGHGLVEGERLGLVARPRLGA